MAQTFPPVPVDGNGGTRRPPWHKSLIAVFWRSAEKL